MITPSVKDRLEALLQEHRAANPKDYLDLEFHLAAQEARRKLGHQEHKRNRRPLGLTTSVGTLANLKAEALKPSTEAEADHNMTQDLMLSAREQIDEAKDLEDIFYALLRAWRQMWAMSMRHYPIEGIDDSKKAGSEKQKPDVPA